MKTLLYRELTQTQQIAALAIRPDAARLMWFVSASGEMWPKLTMTAITYHRK